MSGACANTATDDSTMSDSPASVRTDRYRPIGAEVLSTGISFRVWAPKHERVAVVLDGGSELTLSPDGDGYFIGVSKQAKAGDRYRFRLGDDEKLYPDPASRFQPEGPHGPSQIVDPNTFQWTDGDWNGRPADEMVLYEMHVGTFTAAGNFRAAMERLPFLAEVGITCIEMMPVADFAGDWNWGYDGVNLFAPTRNYGTPDDLRAFVNRAHELGMCVILDLVYNHVGPDGNYLAQFSDTFFSKKHQTDWGAGINFDDEGAHGAREYYLTNTRYWIEEFHFDGYRFDATQNIYDDSSPHILAEISSAARAAGGRRLIYLINENEPQQTKLVRPQSAGGYAMDALWNDDFHHSAMVSLTGHTEAYYTDYAGSPQEFISCLKWGYLYQGQTYRWQRKRRGTPGFDLPPTAFVNYVQNHDQIANFGMGYRLDRMSSFARFRAMTMLLLLAPQPPMLFQGQEFLASTPFNFFSCFGPELAKMVKEGRIREVTQFPSTRDREMIKQLPDPGKRETFYNCKLQWDEAEKGQHGECLKLHRELLRIRREDEVLRRSQKQRSIDGAVLGPEAFVIRFFGTQDNDRLMIINFGVDLNLSIVPEPLMAPPAGARWESILSTEEPRFGGHGAFPLEGQGEPWRLDGEIWRVPGRSGTLLKPVPAPPAEKQT
jgi:maltooligosyltrehalose trehalohydrolase